MSVNPVLLGNTEFTLLDGGGFRVRYVRFVEPAMATDCTHLDQVEITELPEAVAGCEDCLREGGRWLHLRICLTCGHVGCCDDSPNRHATAHAHATEHPLIRSLEPGEEWCWCYPDELAMAIPAIHGRTRIPPSPLLGG